MNTFVKRTLSGIVYVGIVVSAILMESWTFGIVFALLSALTVRELMHLMHMPVTQTILSVLMAVVLFCSCYFEDGQIDTLYGFLLYGVLLIGSLVIELFTKAENPIHNWGYILMGQVMIALPFALMTQIMVESNYLLLSLFILIWLNDSGAYIIGSLMSKRAGGNHQMFARVSPNKSWEGLIGGVLVALAASIVLYELDWIDELPFALAFSLIICVFGTLGDLMESLFKRTLGIKDSGNIMPGHGGALDRFDSVLLATPVVWLFLLYWLA